MDNLSHRRTPYGGLAFDIDFAIHGAGLVEDVIFRPVAVLDAPFSAVADTATLPLTIAASIQHEVERRQWLIENDWKVKLAESAYYDEDGLKFGQIPAPGREDSIPGTSSRLAE